MYRLGRKSLEELTGVHPRLVSQVKMAITVTPVDFSVHDGIRTSDEQLEYVRTGVSKTLRSYHIPALPRNRGWSTPYGQAVDLVPYINGKLRWEWEPIYQVAQAMHESLDLIGAGNKIRWGAVWDRTLDELDPFNLESEREAYRERQFAQGKRAFLDGPHFQIEIHNLKDKD